MFKTCLNVFKVSFSRLKEKRKQCLILFRVKRISTIFIVTRWRVLSFERTLINLCNLFLFIRIGKGSLGASSVTRLGDLLHFGQLFKPGGQNYFAQILHSFAIFVKVSKSFISLMEPILGNFYRQLAIFSCHTGHKAPVDFLFTEASHYSRGLNYYNNAGVTHLFFEEGVSIPPKSAAHSWPDNVLCVYECQTSREGIKNS